MPNLSVIVITRNESTQIVDCLDSVRFADEWIVVDCGSRDDTVELARNWGAQVYVHSEWRGFGRQKNLSLGYATGKWVLSIDADERVTGELAAEIQRVILSPAAAAGYTMPRLSSYCGRFLRHGGWWPDRVLRLFRRESGQFTNLVVHESVEVRGSVKKLQGHLIHYTYSTLESVIDKVNAYSSAGAQRMYEQGRSAGVWQAVLHGAWAFCRGYVLRAGFLDGARGLMAAVSNAESTYYRYIKRWLMEQPGSISGYSGVAGGNQEQLRLAHRTRKDFEVVAKR
jgi:glycosyltransferase involved in cell wall biosynthesis